MVTARGPGCLVLWDAWRKDRRRDRKDKFRTLYLDPLAFLCLWKLTHRGTSMASLTSASKADQAKEGTAGDQKVGVFIFLALNLPGPSLMSAPL